MCLRALHNYEHTGVHLADDAACCFSFSECVYAREVLRGLGGGSFAVKAALERFDALVTLVRLKHFGRGASVVKSFRVCEEGAEGGCSLPAVNSRVSNLLHQLHKIFSLAAVVEACRFSPYVGQPPGTAQQRDAAARSQVLRHEVLV